MNPNTFPTKGNLILAKNSLALAKQGYELMDKKRNILIRELMDLIDKAKNIQTEIDGTFTNAYKALQKANIEMGIRNVEDLSSTIPEETSIEVKQRSIMGAEIPLVEFDISESNKPTYSFFNTRLSLDEATNRFKKVKELTLRLAMIENAAYRLATSINKTQKRANALKNITIPYYTGLTRDIQNALEEKEREEFTRLKVIKRRRDEE
ncbi:V-type ATP synthase subunit D [Anaerocolumna cellulosilytica]|uniref:V-type ATP synthase subunit D n=1 Tax=Anaerocolumna cellulosilytica TaxID=433286 RepID=A0A6S6RDA3_9FIRM|nr:V-type ATP synthase subunit D [Anaerocolumna cellulosilytica]MBB5195924.1 V/A-type H+-transporting ATPase subunit D [Anaerocolumna cellulosilytica]BCJ96935.1 V-type ATP synthase subunit D [Anaerocolumna cellulosilytica]